MVGETFAAHQVWRVVGKLKDYARAEHRHEILEPTADFGARRRGDDLLREWRKKIADFCPENQVTAHAILHAAAHGDERPQLLRLRQIGKIAQRLVSLLRACS